MIVLKIQKDLRLFLKRLLIAKIKKYGLRQREVYMHGLLNDKIPFLQPLEESESREIQAFWEPYLKGMSLFDLRHFSFYKYVQSVHKTKWPLSYYMPDDFWEVYVDAFLTNPKMSKVLDDKNLYDLYFYDINRPRTIFRKIGDVFLDKDYQIIDFDTVCQFCNLEDEIIIKKASDSVGGKGVFFWNNKMPKQMLLSFLKDDNLIAQEVVKQHSVLDDIHSSSINTIRIMTMCFDNEIVPLSSLLRMGVNQARVDNAHSGGIFCGINEDGSLKPIAFDVTGKVYMHHPQGAIFSEIKIPNYDKCLDLLKKISMRLSNATKLQSWDISIDEHGNPMLIEINATFGGIDFHQMCNGPIMGNLTPKLLDYVFEYNPLLNKNRRKNIDEETLTNDILSAAGL